jgi:hypothetical protein
MFGRVGFGDLVEDLACIFEGLEAVRYPVRNVDHAPICRAKLDGHPSAKGRRERTQVKDHVVNRAGSAPHELGFLEWRGLVMHSAQGAAPVVERDAALGD